MKYNPHVTKCESQSYLFLNEKSPVEPNVKMTVLPDYITFFFEKSANDTTSFKCRNEKCIARTNRNSNRRLYKQSESSGFTNLKNHLRSCIGPNYLEIYNNRKNLAGGFIDGYFFASPRDADVFQLIEWMIMRNHSFAEVDDILTRNLMKVKPLSSKLLRKLVSSMTPLVEKTVKQHLPEKIGILFDGWSDSGVHYVAIFATYVK